MTYKGHKGRGRVSRSFGRMKKYEEDEEFREKKKRYARELYRKNKGRITERRRKWERELSKFKNHRCKDCDKLLDYRAKGDYCIKCMNKKENKK